MVEIYQCFGGYLQMWVNFYQTTWCHILKSCFLHSQSTRNLISHTELCDDGNGSRSGVGDEYEYRPEQVPSFTQATAAY